MCLGGFLGMFLGAMFGFAVCMKYMVDRVNRDDGSVSSNQSLWPFVGIMAGACVGAAIGALMVRLMFVIYTTVFSSPADKR